MRFTPHYKPLKSGGAATIIVAQGFNPGNESPSKAKKGGALARGFPYRPDFREDYLAGPPDLWYGNDHLLRAIRPLIPDLRRSLNLPNRHPQPLSKIDQRVHFGAGWKNLRRLRQERTHEAGVILQIL